MVNIFGWPHQWSQMLQASAVTRKNTQKGDNICSKCLNLRFNLLLQDLTSQDPDNRNKFKVSKRQRLYKEATTIFFMQILMVNIWPALVQDTNYMVEKTYHKAPYLGAFGAYLMPQWPINGSKGVFIYKKQLIGISGFCC